MTVAASALLLVDLQRDYLDRPGLNPPEATLLASVQRLADGFRAAGAPVAHVHTLVRPDGSDAMPHWREPGRLACVAGTPGAEPPPQAAPQSGEVVVAKQQYRGFADPALDAHLRAAGVTRVVIAGVYEQACVRETVLDAYERGYEVIVVADAVGTDDPEHADATRRWLTGRAATYLAVDEVLAALPAPDAGRSTIVVPVAREVDDAVSAAGEAQRRWRSVDEARRADLLDAWSDVLLDARHELVQAIVDEVRKPVRHARDEVDRAIAHVRTSSRLLRDVERSHPRRLAPGVEVRHEPLGVVGLLMPWNNPVALPAAKVAAAVAEGNGVVLAPSVHGMGCAVLLQRTWIEAGLPAGLVQVVAGGAAAGRAVVEHPGIDGVALTGSVAVGRAVALRCAQRGIPLQAELGGNNAAVVLADADLAVDVPMVVRGAFSFAGQRCTAVRRLVIPRSSLEAALPLVADAVASVVVGDPAGEDTDMGPLVSGPARDAVAAALQGAVARGSTIVARGTVPDAPPTGDAWLAPVAVLVEDPGDPLVQQETFGPVLVVQPADDLDHAIALADGVDHGLLMAVCGRSPELVQRVLDRARVGIVSVGASPPAIHPDAPFGGWKASGSGPPEHGEWDRWFFSRVQAVYGRP